MNADKLPGRGVNSLSTVRVFKVMLERVEAGEPWRKVLQDYGFTDAQEEQEACAKLSEGLAKGEWSGTAAECSGECGDDIAKRIRARSSQMGGATGGENDRP